ncbi:MAG TPA: gamma-glutamylcyclotransferase [Burkholderiaceae bacterium]
MTTPTDPPTTAYGQTRRRLQDGSFVAALRANPPPGVRLRSDAELEATLAEALAAHDASEDVFVFGYGSLMWNPALDAIDARVARVAGWHRRFCLRSFVGRGAPESPGVMLALDRGGACRGLVFRIAAAKARAELRLLWRREMISGSYDARWVCARAGGDSVRALTFVVDRRLDRYIAERAPEHVLQLISTGRGALGTARDYFDATRRTLRQLGIRDVGIERLHRALLESAA